MPPHPGTVILKGFRFEGGATVDCEIGYWTLGTLNPQQTNALLLCPGASGNRDWALPYCRPGGAFDPDRWFIVSIDLPGGGASSRGSRAAGFPDDYSVGDLAAAIAGLVTEMGLTRRVAFAGASLAGLVGLELAARHPELIAALALWNGGIRCDGYASAVADTIGAAIALDRGEPGLRVAIGAFLPSALGRDLLAGTGAAARREMIAAMAKDWAAAWHGRDLAARYRCVAAADLPERHGGAAVLAGRIACPTLWLSSSTDVIFPAADVEAFALLLDDAQVHVCATDRGHIATASPPASDEFAFYDTRTAAFLDRIAA